jgi:hypothetical protein
MDQDEISKQFLHHSRMMMEYPVYTLLKYKYGSMLKDFWKNATIPKESKYTILLVERRKHENIEFVLQNALYYTQPHKFSVTIVCSDENEDYVKECVGNQIDSVTILPIFKGIGTRDQGRNEYNELFVNVEFWTKINAEYILSIQTDSYFRKRIPDILFTLDYAACPFAWDESLLGGGGGLTWRKRDFCIEACNLPFNKNIGEDIFFAKSCKLLEKNVLSFEEGKEIFAESCLVEDPIGLHQWWTFWSQLIGYEDDDYTKFLFDSYTTCKIYDS